ncbi:hypothetical protein BU25DRAFT_423681 [Macroventuria anomochaeta]|uniref:Uncharacterized protein n=1 Tax=Macroventuria anomochaeta TaxID=301207 RepID=A0ACB6RUU0_9PLEO|nr:uncharacterized protein BU25DRAFT_423681 [Macroventuria anomochaeta]KAF2624914.1 hypothetical protein BU25DRAFT_423681 [Macroventuria anomochaeta]
MYSGYWANLPAANTPVDPLHVDPDFHENLCYRLRQLREQNLTRRELFGEEALEYRTGHTPQTIREQEQVHTEKMEYIKWLEPETHPTPLTPVSFVDSKDYGSPVWIRNLGSSPNSTQSTVSPSTAPLKLSPALSGKYRIEPPPSTDSKKRKRISKEDDGPYNEAGRQHAFCTASPHRQSKGLRSRASACHTSGHQ